MIPLSVYLPELPEHWPQHDPIISLITWTTWALTSTWSHYQFNCAFSAVDDVSPVPLDNRFPSPCFGGQVAARCLTSTGEWCQCWPSRRQAWAKTRRIPPLCAWSLIQGEQAQRWRSFSICSGILPSCGRCLVQRSARKCKRALRVHRFTGMDRPSGAPGVFPLVQPQSLLNTNNQVLCVPGEWAASWVAYCISQGWTVHQEIQEDYQMNTPFQADNIMFFICQ